MIGFERLRFGLGTVGLVVAGLSWMPEGLADSFHLKSGKVVEAEIIKADRNTVILRSRGAVLPVSLGLIERIVLSLADGKELSGEFLGWKSGVYEIRSDNLLMQVKDGEIIEGVSEIASPELETEPVAQPISPEPKPAPEPEPVGTVAMQGLPEFTMKSGEVLNGQIIHATGSIVTVRLHEGGVVPTSRAQIDKIRFIGQDGVVLSGRFKNWSDNVYELEVDDQDLLASLSDQAASSGPTLALQSQAIDIEASNDETEETVIDLADAAISPEPETDLGPDRGLTPSNQTSEIEPRVPDDDEADAGDGTDLSDDTGAGGPVTDAAVAALSETETSLAPSSLDEKEENRPTTTAGPHLIEPSVVDVGEDSDAVVFKFRLRQPTDRPLVILYAATDDTALAGKDFEAKSGVITFNPGSEYAEVRVPLIDDEESEFERTVPSLPFG